MKLSAREPVIFADDFKSMVDWYQNVLGFEITQLVEQGYHYCNLENQQGIQLGIADAREMGVNPGDRRNNTVVLQFEVSDVGKFLEHVKGNGGSNIFGPSFDEKDAFWFGGFADVEGNPFWVVDENCP